MQDYQKEYQRWMAAELEDFDLKRELQCMAGQEEEIKEHFARALEFGTAGIRGTLGAGTNRMNLFVVRQATEGLARYILEEKLEKLVAISYDSRLKGWTWVDGYCYFLKDNGTMATEEKTPDGYSISANGQWVQDGKPVHEEGKGVSSRRSVQVEKEIKAGAAEGQQINANGEEQNPVIKGIAGSGGGGGFSGASGSGSGGSSAGGSSSSGGFGSGSGSSFASASGSAASSVVGGFHSGAGNSSGTVVTGSRQSYLFSDGQSDSVSNTEESTGFSSEATDEENTFSEEEWVRRAEKQRKQAEKELAKRKKILEKIENGQNNNIVEYETEEGEKRTVLFVKD